MVTKISRCTVFVIDDISEKGSSLIPTLRSEKNLPMFRLNASVLIWVRFPISSLASKNSLFCSCRSQLRSNLFEIMYHWLYTLTDLPCLLSLTTCCYIVVHSLPGLTSLLKLPYPVLRDNRYDCIVLYPGICPWFVTQFWRQIGRKMWKDLHVIRCLCCVTGSFDSSACVPGARLSLSCNFWFPPLPLHVMSVVAPSRL